MRKDGLKDRKRIGKDNFGIKMNQNRLYFRIFQICARMTHFGEMTEFIEDDPVNLMVPSDSTITVSILNYRPRNFIIASFYKSNRKEKDL